MCCNLGEIQFRKIWSCPPILQKLYKQESQLSNVFLKRIRNFNSALAFTSLGAKIIPVANYGESIFKIEGTTHHRIPSLINTDGNPVFGQIYFYDPESELDRRANITGMEFVTLEELQILKILQNMIHDSNRFYSQFQNALDMVKQNPTIDLTIVIENDLRATKEKKRIYNKPTTKDIAILIDDKGSGEKTRSIILKTKTSSSMQSINKFHPSYDALQYVLLHPYGETTWHRNLKGSCRQYYAFKLMMRQNTFNPLHYARKLYQQYIVDQWAKVEQDKFNYYYTHQKELCADLYFEVEESLESDNFDASATGRSILLPTSYHGGPRFMRANYQDVMALVREYGKPSLFITFTFNPYCKELLDLLNEGETPYDRPDLMARIFKLKTQEFENDMFKRNVLSDTVAWCWTQEYQKRTNPHKHYVVTFAQHHQIRNSD